MRKRGLITRLEKAARVDSSASRRGFGLFRISVSKPFSEAAVTHCGWQALACLHFDANDARRQAWNGKWPGEEDCERLGFFVNGDADFPDLNRLFTDCVWDADTQRWERKQ